MPGRYFLIDCGEGTQHQLRRNRINFNRIGHILISHLHGDHFFGLIGLISSLMLMGRKTDLHLYAHSDLQRYTNFQIELLGMTDLGFRLIFHPLDFKKPRIIYEDNRLSIASFPLDHRIPCCGFRFDEKPPQPNLIKEQLKRFKVPVSEMKRLKAGEDYLTEDGAIIPNDQFVLPFRKPSSYAYCSDTAYLESIADAARDVTVLYHEATFSEADRNTAKATSHSTALEAGRIAQMANAGKLLIGHFSSRYKTTDDLLAEARTVFPETYAVNDNDVFTF